MALMRTFGHFQNELFSNRTLEWTNHKQISFLNPEQVKPNEQFLLTAYMVLKCVAGFNV